MYTQQRGNIICVLRVVGADSICPDKLGQSEGGTHNNFLNIFDFVLAPECPRSPGELGISGARSRDDFPSTDPRGAENGLEDTECKRVEGQTTHGFCM